MILIKNIIINKSHTCLKDGSNMKDLIEKINAVNNSVAALVEITNKITYKIHINIHL